LKILSLRGNSIGDDAAVCIAQMLTINMALRTVYVGGFGKRGLAAFAASLPQMRGLEDLDIGPNVKDFTSEIGNSFVSALECNTTLKRVTLYNEGEPPSPHAAKIMSRVNHLLALNRGGRRILHAPNVPDSLWPHILGRSSDDNNVIFHFLREKPGVVSNMTRNRKRKREHDVYSS
jgi:hypothetical protein